MEFDNSFEVPLPLDDAWKLLMDIRRIAPCMPGADLTDVIDDRTYKGRINVRLGPVALTFAGTVKFEEIDDANHKARVAAQGSDAKGRGGANAVAAFHLEPAPDGSKVLVHTNLTLSGAVAQYGRGVGIIQMTAAQIITQFANNLKAQLETVGAPPATAQRAAASPAPLAATTSVATVAPATPTPSTARPAPDVPAPVALIPVPPTPVAPTPAQPPAAKPISGLTLMAQVLWQFVKRLFRRAQ